MIGFSRSASGRRVGRGVLYRQSVVALTAGTLVTAAFVIPAQTDRITLSVRRPTTAQPLDFDATSRLGVTLVVSADGVEHRYRGQVTGGTRVIEGEGEAPAYQLVITPTWGFFGATSGLPKRLGETCTLYTARLELERLAGSITTLVELIHGTSAAPAVPFSQTVAFDTATDAQETTGDGVLSLSHTATGSDLAAFAGVEIFAGTTTSTSVTYAGTGMTEAWDFTYATSNGNAGYRLAGPTAGAQTVTSTIGDTTPDRHFLGVISMTGVDQTTPVGTPATANGTTSPATVTVGSVGADDLVVDNMKVFATPTIGADQTESYNDIGGAQNVRGATQPGTAGGVMSWTFTNATWGTGAIAFKPSAAAAAPPMLPLLGVGMLLADQTPITRRAWGQRLGLAGVLSWLSLGRAWWGR